MIRCDAAEARGADVPAARTAAGDDDAARAERARSGSVIEVRTDGLHIDNAGSATLIPWSEICGVEEDPDGVSVHVATGTFRIPYRSLPSPVLREPLLHHLRSGGRMATATASPTVTIEPASPAPPRRTAAGLRDLGANLQAGLRAALFLPVKLGQLRLSPGQMVALFALDIGLALLQGFAGSPGAGGQLDLYALPRVLLYVPLLLLAAWVVAAWRRNPALLAALPILYCSVSLPYDLAFTALDYVIAHDRLPEPWDQYLWYGLYATWLAAFLVGAARLAAAGILRGFVQSAILVGLVVLPLWYLPQLPLWEVPEERTADVDRYALSREEVFYAQPGLLERQLAALAPERPGIPDLYFVGVAAYAAEDVFMKELEVISALFRDRFDADGRSVLLVNNPKTVAQLPVATATSLARTLEQVGRVMNPDEDVLFLYLTSHGSRDHRLAVQFWPLQLSDIDPPSLRRMLDRAGIKWRVIVISACYSGGFIDALQDDHTLVLTAADATHTSFGCGSQSDFTYFGRAYFDEALRATWSFTDAFGAARKTIAARESAELLTPSNPQMYAGARIEAKLRAISERLRALPSRPQVLRAAAPSAAPITRCERC